MVPYGAHHYVAGSEKLINSASAHSSPGETDSQPRGECGWGWGVYVLKFQMLNTYKDRPNYSCNQWMS